MDWPDVYQQVTAGSPLAVGAALVWVALSTRRSVLATLGRFGARVGRLEQARAGDTEAARLERVRRWQLETALLEAGIAIPAWPDTADVEVSPPARHRLPDWMPSS